jgi:hypothetical protein
MSEQVPARATETIPPAARPAVSPVTLADLTVEIQKAHSDVMNALGAGAAAAIRAGNALLHAKALHKKQKGHGSWQDYIAVECRLGVRTAQIYMFLAKHEDQLYQLLMAKPNANSVLTQGAALKLLGAARKNRKRRVVKTPQSPTMTKPQSEPLVRR